MLIPDATSGEPIVANSQQSTLGEPDVALRFAPGERLPPRPTNCRGGDGARTLPRRSARSPEWCQIVINAALRDPHRRVVGLDERPITLVESVPDQQAALARRNPYRIEIRIPQELSRAATARHSASLRLSSTNPSTSRGVVPANHAQLAGITNHTLGATIAPALPTMFGLRLSIVGISIIVPSVALAHIHLTFPLARTDSATGDQKEEHCGTPGWVRGDHPERTSVFLPGQTITVTWDETIQHPGYFRIALQPNAGAELDLFGIPPCGVDVGDPINCGVDNFPTLNQEGIDPINGSIVIKDQILDGTLSQEITLPNLECANCTLQFIQVMTDKNPYTRDALSDDIYFNCADVVLSATAPDAGPGGPGGMPDAGGGNPGDPDAGGGGGGGPVTGGCSAGGSVGMMVSLVLVGLRRRRRS